MKTIILTFEDFNGNKDNYYNFKRCIEEAQKQLRYAIRYSNDKLPRVEPALEYISSFEFKHSEITK